MASISADKIRYCKILHKVSKNSMLKVDIGYYGSNLDIRAAQILTRLEISVWNFYDLKISSHYFANVCFLWFVVCIHHAYVLVYPISRNTNNMSTFSDPMSVKWLYPFFLNFNDIYRSLYLFIQESVIKKFCHQKLGEVSNSISNSYRC